MNYWLEIIIQVDLDIIGLESVILFCLWKVENFLSNYVNGFYKD